MEHFRVDVLCHLHEQEVVAVVALADDSLEVVGADGGNTVAEHVKAVSAVCESSNEIAS